MRGFRRWPEIQALMAAHLLCISAIGLVQFATTQALHPGFCIPVEPPGVLLWYWLRSGLEHPLSELFDNTAVLHIRVTLTGIIVSGIWLGWSVWSMRPARLNLNLRLRTLMLFIALVPIEWMVGGEVWKSWNRWDDYRRLGNHYARLEEIGLEMAM